MTYYHDPVTDTVRRFEGESQAGQRWDKKTHCWSEECCARSACRWDEEISEGQAREIIDQQ